LLERYVVTDSDSQSLFRRAAISVLLGLAVVGGVIGAVWGLLSVMERDRQVTLGHVPDVVGVLERDAVKMLDQAGLAAEIRWEGKAPGDGKVLGSEPPADAELAPGGIVVLFVSWPPPFHPPPPGINPEERFTFFGGLIDAHPDTFVGYYIDDADGVPVIVLPSGVDAEPWRERLETALGKGNKEYRTETCSRSRDELYRVQDEIEPSLFPHEIGFVTSPDPATCTVRIDSDQLTRADMHLLIARFGTAVSFNTSEGNHPERLEGGG